MTQAIIFPGQGSQSVGMLTDIAKEFSEIPTVFTEASAILNYDLWELVVNGPASELDKTMRTQPILLTSSYAVWQILKKHASTQPQFLAGHSLGEYTALVCADALAFSDALKLVEARGKFMQEAVPLGVGAMAAIIGLEENKIAEICNEVTATNEIVSPANFNSLGQVVIAGHTQAVQRAINLAKERGAKLATLLPVSVPSHCELMRPAAERLEKMLTNITFNSLSIPVVGNVTAMPYQSVNEIKQGLIKQLYSPVQWVKTIQYFINQHITQIVECGPGKVLTGLNKRIDKNLQLFSTDDYIRQAVHDE